MTFYVFAQNEDRSETLYREIEAETFEEALEELKRLARWRWPNQPWHPTHVAERPEISRSGPIALALQLGGSRS